MNNNSSKIAKSVNLSTPTPLLHNPVEFSSGSSIKGRVRICKQGGKQLRHILYMGAMNAKTTNRACRELYDRLVENGKNKKATLIAVCNKLLKQVFGCVKKKTKFIDDYQINIL